MDNNGGNKLIQNINKKIENENKLNIKSFY